MTVLIRLIVADGEPVTADALYRDCWPSAEPRPHDYRTQVQKRILQIRRAVDPGWSGKSGRESLVLPTERGRVTAYRLVVDRGAIDVFRFIELVAQARRSAAVDGIGFLEEAMALWAGPPLLDVGDKSWAADLVRQLTGLRHAARHELARGYQLSGRATDALDVAEVLAAASPGDIDLQAQVERLRAQVRTGRGSRVSRAGIAGLRTAVAVMTGDLFAQDDANLVIGFSDTFDTDTDRNIVISAESSQGRLLHTLYGGDRIRLDKDLRAALARVPKVAVESRSAKTRGKLTRYPVGTVATLHHATRRIFAVAYSRMGNDLMAWSSLPVLRASLDNLWDAVYRHGQLKPVAMPLVGAGLSRTGATDGELLTMIVSSFLAGTREHYLGPELRVLVPEPVFDQIDVPVALKSALDGSPGLPNALGAAYDRA
jgi:hypothetical protein